jgi:hypothetical protein
MPLTPEQMRELSHRLVDAVDAEQQRFALGSEDRLQVIAALFWGELQRAGYKLPRAKLDRVSHAFSSFEIETRTVRPFRG